jgi:D-alanine-D-alanine ligase-like ATP-grasp enzyme
MEIIFLDKANPRPVYDYQIKQEWEKHVYYQCPAKLTPAELKSMERIARETFVALDCRDVARVDLRMDEAGEIYVLEVNPLPGLTPNIPICASLPMRREHRLPHAHRRNPHRRAQAHARKAPCRRA